MPLSNRYVSILDYRVVSQDNNRTNSNWVSGIGEMVITTKTILVRDFISLLENMVNEYGRTHELTHSDSDIRDFAYSVKSNPQLRDLLIGLPADIAEHQGFTETEAIEFCGAFLETVAKHPAMTMEYRVPIMSVLSLYHLEIGNDEVARKLLTTARETDADYGLTNLLYNMLDMPSALRGLSEMRKQLHPRVKEIINEIIDKPVDNKE